jgi:4-hydroxy-tetrahydrodipicolinate synthase
MSAASEGEFTVSGGQVGVDTGFRDRQFDGPDTGYNEQLLNASKMERVKGARLITAVKTPYAYSGRIDLNAFDRLVDFQLQNGVEGLVVGGTTGEGHLMNWDEHLTLIEHCSATYGDQLAIVGNVGSNSTMESFKAAQEGFRAGMHGALIINPYYGKTSPAGVRFHLEQVMDLGPSIVYNVPSRTAQDIPPEIMLELAKHENFAGVKECTGHERIAQYAAEGILCWSGNDDECFESRWKHGGHGVISVTSNMLPGVMSKLMTSESAGELNDRVQPFMSWLFDEPNPIALNTVMAMTGGASPVFRAPYWPYAKDKREHGAKCLEPFLASEIYGGTPQVLEDGDFKVLGTWARGVSYIKGADGKRNF